MTRRFPASMMMLVVWAAVGGTAQTSVADLVPFDQYVEIVKDSQNAYRNGDFETAFRLCSRAARWGEKDCQYMLAMMHLSGKGAEADIVEGYAWYTVAVESGNPKWMPVYRELTEKLPPPVIEAGRRRGAEYVASYGMQATGVRCTRTQMNDALIGQKETICSCPDTVDRSAYDQDPCPTRTRAGVGVPKDRRW